MTNKSHPLRLDRHEKAIRIEAPVSFIALSTLTLTRCANEHVSRYVSHRAMGRGSGGGGNPGHFLHETLSRIVVGSCNACSNARVVSQERPFILLGTVQPSTQAHLKCERSSDTSMRRLFFVQSNTPPPRPYHRMTHIPSYSLIPIDII